MEKLVTTMPNAPLCYTLAMVRFAPIAIDRYVDAFHEGIRSRYPLKTEHKQQGFEVHVEAGTPPGFKSINYMLWQWAEVGRGHALILGPEFLVLHAGAAYAGHADFLGRVREIVRILEGLEGLNPIMTALGFRYVDLVVPRAEESLVAYLESWVIPSGEVDLSQDGLRFLDSAYVAAFRTEQSVLRFQALRHPPATLPPELDTPMVRENGWIVDRPAGEFAILDFDHAMSFSIPAALDHDSVLTKLDELRKQAKAVFMKTVKPYAHEVWEGRK